MGEQDLYASEYNPWIEKCKYIESKIKELISSEDKIQSKIIWFDGLGLGVLQKKQQDAAADLQMKRETLSSIKSELGTLNASLKTVEQSIGTLFNPLNWYANDQMRYRLERGRLRECIQQVKKRILTAERNVGASEVLALSAESAVQKYLAFDREEAAEEAARLRDEIASMRRELGQATELRQKINISIEPYIAKIRELKEQIAIETSQLRAAETIDRQLDSAPNSYEKALLHEQCEQKFGDGSPKRVMRQKKSLLDRLQRDLDKCTHRAAEGKRIADRVIRRLVLDGNNLAYEGNQFIGLSAIRSIGKQLSKQYNCHLVFDASICKMLDSSSRTISAALADWYTVHIVNSGRQADETILDLASADESSFVVSNDGSSNIPTRRLCPRGASYATRFSAG